MEIVDDGTQSFNIDFGPQIDSEWMQFTQPSRFSVENPQTMGDTWYEAPLTALDTEPNALSDCVGLMTGQDEQPHLDPEGHDWSNLLTQFLHQHTPAPTPSYTETYAVLNANDNSSHQGPINEVVELANPPTGACNQLDIRDASKQGNTSAFRRPRKQNHSCDPCRVGKKACDLPLDIVFDGQKPSTPCSTCNSRGHECTVAWLVRRQASQLTRKRTKIVVRSPEPPRTSEDPADLDGGPTTEASLFDGLTITSKPERDIVRQFTAQTTCSQHFNLYIDIYDMPITECLSQGCIPPCYSAGIAALTPLSNSMHSAAYLDKALLGIRNCWDTNSRSWASTAAAPHLFFTVSVLDALFEKPFARFGRESFSSRDIAINETYMWIATATAAQFVIESDESSDMAKSRARARDFASATWHKAKQKVFENIASTNSFRLSLALLLFGGILSPAGTPQSNEFREDAKYAYCEGVRRLQALCSRARACLLENSDSHLPVSAGSLPGPKKVPSLPFSLPSDVRGYVLQLIGAIDWLVSMANSVAIAFSRGKICAIPPDPPRCDTEIWPGPIGMDTGVIASDVSTTLQNEEEIDRSIVIRAEGESMTVMTLWHRDISDETMYDAVNKSGALVVLLEKSLAALIMAVEDLGQGQADYKTIHHHYVRTSTLVTLWRSTFGRFDHSTRSKIRQSGPQVRRGLYFCSNDGDLAILQFCEAIHRLQNQLSNQPSTPAKDNLLRVIRSTAGERHDQRLESARQVAFLASTYRGVSSPGFQGKYGLKACIPDISAHPVSIVQIAFKFVQLVLIHATHRFRL
jgi:hypothetical protein